MNKIKGTYIKIGRKRKIICQSCQKKFKEDLEITTATLVRRRKLKRNIGTENENKIYTAYGVEVSSHRMAYDLFSNGITNNKSMTIGNFLENIDDDLIIHAIRGYFDGDGTIGITKDRRNYPWFSVLGTKVVINKIFDFFDVNSKNIKSTKNNITYKGIISKRSDIVKVLKELYLGSTISLDRKYNYAVKIINQKPNK